MLILSPFTNNNQVKSWKHVSDRCAIESFCHVILNPNAVNRVVCQEDKSILLSLFCQALEQIQIDFSSQAHLFE
jgi:hypothetical protein